MPKMKTHSGASKRFRVTGEGYTPTGQFSVDGNAFDMKSDPEAALLLQGALLCNDAHLHHHGGPWQPEGDPREGALLAFAITAGGLRGRLATSGKRPIRLVRAAIMLSSDQVSRKRLWYG